MKIFMILLALVTASPAAAQQWPEHTVSARELAIAQQKASEYIARKGRKPDEMTKRYSASGPYLWYGKRQFRTAGRMKLDDDGVAMIDYSGEFYYNPITVAHQALAEYSRPDGPSSTFLKIADRLMELQGEDGAFRYAFPFPNYALGFTYEPGWISGMAQGQALSVFARAWHLTKEQKYLDAGNAALDFLQVPVEEGGPMNDMGDLDPSLKGFIFFDEYPSDPSVYTLNGYQFTVLGLYDWRVLAESETAKTLFGKSLQTLLHILPYYDLGAMVAYDLGHMTVPARHGKPHISIPYHPVHIELLWTLGSFTGQKALIETADRWNYMNAPFKAKPEK